MDTVPKTIASNCIKPLVAAILVSPKHTTTQLLVWVEVPKLPVFKLLSNTVNYLPKTIASNCIKPLVAAILVSPKHTATVL